MSKSQLDSFCAQLSLSTRDGIHKQYKAHHTRIIKENEQLAHTPARSPGRQNEMATSNDLDVG